MHDWYTFGASSPNVWRVIAPRTQIPGILSRNVQIALRVTVTPYSKPAERILSCIYLANLINLARIYYKLSLNFLELKIGKKTLKVKVNIKIFSILILNGWQQPGFWTHGRNSVTAWPVVSVLQVTIVPYQSVACRASRCDFCREEFYIVLNTCIFVVKFAHDINLISEELWWR